MTTYYGEIDFETNKVLWYSTNSDVFTSDITGKVQIIPVEFYEQLGLPTLVEQEPEQQPPSDTDVLKAENKILKERQGFLEDCIAELSGIVYN